MKKIDAEFIFWEVYRIKGYCAFFL